MTPEHSVQFTSGTPETVLDPLAPDLAAALDAARSLPPDRRRDAVAAVAAQDPRCLQAWADLAELAGDPIERYAFARVGYHRGSTRCGPPAGAARATCAGATSPTAASSGRCTTCSWPPAPSARWTRSSAATSSCASSTPNGAPGSPEARPGPSPRGRVPLHVVRVSNCMMVEVSVTSPPRPTRPRREERRPPRLEATAPPPVLGTYGRVAAWLSKRVEVALAQVELTLPQYRVLGILAEGSAAASGLADRLAVRGHPSRP